ncbi:MAG TPA: alpha-amylase family glycosyl hydrolase [Anaerolineaceae bacterium]|nr:alpha-amylase family glycosyl hydrolase [Anaerolineaceae bacterium]
MLEFHLSRPARNTYDFKSLNFSSTGKVLFANHQATRQFADEVNKKLSAKRGEKKFVQAGQVNALATIQAIFQHVLHEYYAENGPTVRADLYKVLTDKLGKGSLDDAIQYFVDEFPPQAVYQNETDLKSYLNASTSGVPNREIALEEMITAWLNNKNPAASSLKDFFDDESLKKRSAYDQVQGGIQNFFSQMPVFGPDNQDLISMLRAPAIAVPDSLKGQLEYMREHWGKLLGEFLLALLGSLDMLREEEKLGFLGAGPTQLPDYTDMANWGDLPEIERFSKDSDWMPRVVMIAKNSFVWLSQLSRFYGRQIERLDQIPDETLDDLARWGFTGLWLIGLWERSDASRRIKQMCGNPDAVSSAYSLSRYQIADRLGGMLAYNNLSERCGKRGIRLASDMVPNHMGIDSDWVYDHPDWFISQDHSPFPSYSFDGPDLSQNPNVSINLEDHYYSRSDAAVVFKRYDHRNGQTKYVYHGNDGTSMPWNDTAQLDYLNPEVREAVIQTILDVARKFPIIRFDAAMTLTKKHYQRLWFPMPGTGGDIPSRADHALTKSQFDDAMPEEFWREVVERVAKEVPDTLLLAEAFWMMEGYFVRTLGMHRVYNSAFMNMLRNEENGKYRELIRSTLVYDPQILQRYVNFMNNPDEKTAVEQFGKGDKYFGICTLMATMPGLPMFGHGQLEGFSEKYGMEYYKPYWDETPDQELMAQHRRRITPILHQRWLFANVDNFRLYNFETGYGVDENVFAYSNAAYGKAALVVYNNRYGSTAGWVRNSSEYLVKGSDPHLESTHLAAALGLEGREGFVKFRDVASGLTYLRQLSDVQDRGLFFQLEAYNHQVLVDFEIVQGQDFAQLYRLLDGKGTWDLEALRHELILQPVLVPFRKLLRRENLTGLVQSSDSKPATRQLLVDENLGVLKTIREKVLALEGRSVKPELDLKTNTTDFLDQVIDLGKLGSGSGLAAFPRVRTVLDDFHGMLKSDPRSQHLLLVWALLTNLVNKADSAENLQSFTTLLNQNPIQKVIQESLQAVGYSDYEAWKNLQILKWLLSLDELPVLKTQKSFNSAALKLFEASLKDPNFKDYLEINRYNEIDWYNGERFDQMLKLWQAVQVVQTFADQKRKQPEIKARLENIQAVIAKLLQAGSLAEFQVEKLLKALN